MTKKSIVIATIVVVLGLGGLVYANLRQKPQNNEQPPSQPVAQSEQEQPLAEKSAYDPSEGGKYLVIKEWGVRMKIADDVREVSYKYRNGGVHLMTSKSKTIPGCEKESFLAVSRGTENEVIAPGDMTVKEMISNGYGDNLERVGKYYFSAAGPQAPCELNYTKQTDRITLGYIQSFGKMFETIEKIPHKNLN